MGFTAVEEPLGGILTFGGWGWIFPRGSDFSMGVMGTGWLSVMGCVRSGLFNKSSI